MKMNNKKIILITIVSMVIVAILACSYFLLLNRKNQNIINPVSKEENTVAESTTLEKIDNYQKRYFEIIKRNDALLDLANENNEVIKDLQELKSLFDEVKNQINKNNSFLEEYIKIKEEYRVNNGNNTLEMNSFASKKYEAFDKLLNDTYKEVKLQISTEEFEKLKNSQRNWLKEVEDYEKVFNSKGFGTIGTLVKLDYEINMRGFRTLLLMLYLKNDNQAKLSDFLGEWSEVNAGRIYLKIEKSDKKGKIIVTYGGANSAYSHSESIYNCKFDEKTYEIICNSAKHTDQFMSCNGISSDDDMSGYLDCVEKNPNSEKDDYKTYSDNKTRILSIKKGTKSRFIIDEDEYMPENRKKEIKRDYENMGLFFKDDKDTLYYKYRG